MKTVSYLIILGLFSMPLAYSMHDAKGRLTVPQTTEEVKIHDQLIAEAKALAASKADTKASAEEEIKKHREETGGMYSVFQATPRNILYSITTYCRNPWSCCEAWLNRHDFKIDHEKVWRFTVLSETTAATVSYTQKTIKIWDLANGKLILTIPEQDQNIASLIKVSDRIIAFGLGDGSIRLWDMHTNQPISTGSCANHSSQIWTLLKFSDTCIISGSIESIAIWDISDIYHPKATIIPQQLKIGTEITKISENSIAFVAIGKNILQIWDIFDKNSSIKLAPVHNKSIKMDRQPTSMIPLTDSITICGAKAEFLGNISNINMIDIKNGEYTPLPKKHLSERCQVLRLSPDQFISCSPHELFIWDGRDSKNIRCIAQFDSLNFPYQNYQFTIGLSAFSFACVDDTFEELFVYAPEPAAFHEFQHLSYNQHIRLQALMHQLHRLNEERRKSARPADPIELTAWGEKWLAAMPEAIQKRLRANFNIKH
jgi:hypothetical protein